MLLSKNKLAQSAYINENCVSIKHEDNFQLLQLLLPKCLHQNDIFKSTLMDKPQLKLKIEKVHKYTLELQMNYVFNFGKSEKIAIKVYQDAKVAEMLYCTNVQLFIRLMGPKIPPKVHMKTRSALNHFLNKWLNYLLNSGYHQGKWLLNQAEDKQS